MDIRQFSPQTQRTLAKRDFNQDNQLSARELDLLKQLPEVAGIAPKDLAVIQDALKKAKGPETIIVSLVDELPPNYKRPEPIFREGGDKPKAAQPGQAAPTRAARPAGATGAPLGGTKPELKAEPGKADDKAKRKGAAPVAEGLSFKVTPQMQDVKSKNQLAQPTAGPETEATGVDVQASAQVGALKLSGSTSVGDQGRSLAAKARASFQPAPELGVEIGIDAGNEPEAEKSKSAKGATSSKPASGKTSSKPAAKPAAPETGSQPAQNLKLSGRLNAGPVKLNAKGKLDSDTSQLKDLSTGAELSLTKGHALRADVKPELGKPTPLNWGSVKLGSSHEVASGLSLTTSTQLDANGRPSKYGGGFKLDYGNGLSLEGDALAKADSTSFARPAQSLRDLDVNVGFRYKRSF